MCPFEVRISVVIPCFNGSQYLHRCVQSVLNQSYTVFEVIIIDDFSTDGSQEMIKEMQNNEHRIVGVLLDRNRGVSYARNQGILKAKGDYITFVDVDDILPPKAIEYYIKAIEAYPGLNVYQGTQNGPILCEEAPFKVCDSFLLKKICLGYPRSLLEYPNLNYNIKNSVHGCYGKLYDLSAIKNADIRFKESLGLGEDLLFYYEMLGISDKICVFDKQVYNLNLEYCSVTRSYNPKMVRYALSFAEVISETETDIELQVDLSYQINQHINKAIECYFCNNDNTENIFVRAGQLKKLLNEKSIHRAYELLTKSKYCRGVRMWKYILLRERFALIYLFIENLIERLLSIKNAFLRGK